MILARHSGAGSNMMAHQGLSVYSLHVLPVCVFFFFLRVLPPTVQTHDAWAPNCLCVSLYVGPGMNRRPVQGFPPPLARCQMGWTPTPLWLTKDEMCRYWFSILRKLKHMNQTLCGVLYYASSQRFFWGVWGVRALSSRHAPGPIPAMGHLFACQSYTAYVFCVTDYYFVAKKFDVWWYVTVCKREKERKGKMVRCAE